MSAKGGQFFHLACQGAARFLTPRQLRYCV